MKAHALTKEAVDAGPNMLSMVSRFDASWPASVFETLMPPPLPPPSLPLLLLPPPLLAVAAVGGGAGAALAGAGPDATLGWLG